VFSVNSFSLEPVGKAPVVSKLLPELSPEQSPELAPQSVSEVALVEGLSSSSISNSSNNDVSDAASEMLLEQLQMELSDEGIQTGQFESLESAIDFYRFLHESGQWSPISDGPLLKLGDAHPQVVELRKLLQLYGDFDLGAEILEPVELFDLQLHHALQHFQQRHGAKADGVLGPKTRRLLNVSPQQRIDQIALNIYRQRQLGLENIEWTNTALDEAELEVTTQENSSRYLQVNIPEYRLRLYDQDKVLLEMKTIIGRRSRQTPSFSAEIKSLVVNPSWNVPRSIAYRDILPKWQKDKTYLARHNLRVIAGWDMPRVVVPDEQIDLERMYRSPAYHRIWEPPSDKNTLGRLKFQLNAGNSIYLHDTKNPHLFESEVRAFSSGCIRLEKPRILADMLLQQSNQWTPQQLEPLFENTDTHRIRLETPIPVHITYWTAWLDDKGILNFADDLYHRDPVDWAHFKSQEQQLQQKVALN
jgi:murein L,D-transpeptidase YcbB/YkuD